MSSLKFATKETPESYWGQCSVTKNEGFLGDMKHFRNIISKNIPITNGSIIELLN